MRAHQHSFGLAKVEVHGVVHITGWMSWRQIERLKVVPVGLDFGSFLDGKSHRDEHVFQTCSSLGHDVGVATP